MARTLWRSRRLLVRRAPGGPLTAGARPMVRALRDAGLAAWFGGSVMGVVGVNRAVQDLSDPAKRLAFVDQVGDRWAVPGALAVTAHLLGSAAMAWDNKGRLLAQRSAPTQLLAMSGLSAAALAATAAAHVTRKQAVSAALDVPHGPGPQGTAPAGVAEAQQRLRLAEYAVLLLTGAVVAVNAVMSEQQRPVATLQGIAARINPRR